MRNDPGLGTCWRCACAVLILCAGACSSDASAPAGAAPTAAIPGAGSPTSPAAVANGPVLAPGSNPTAPPVRSGAAGQSASVPGTSVEPGEPAANGGAAPSGSPGQPVETAPAGKLPCGVHDALASSCQSCHGARPIGGAPMPLVEWADFHRAAVTEPRISVYEMSRLRLTDAARPMPPGAAIEATPKQALIDWFAAGAPSAPAEQAECVPSGATQPVMPVWGAGLTPREDEVCYDFPTHGGQVAGDTTPYMVIPGEHYEQFYFKVPWPKDTIATRMGAKFDNVETLHHWLLFTTTKDASQEGKHETTSGSQIGDEAALLGGWAVGGDDVEYDPDMGMLLPDSGMLNVQWHFYNNADAAVLDASVVQVCTVPRTQREKILGLTWLGTEDFNGLLGMPAHQKSTFEGTCLNDSDGPITIWAFWPHMHKLGRTLRSTIQRVDGTTETAFDMPFDFNRQIHFKMDNVVLQPGDRITSSCDFENTTDSAVAFGPSTTEEMCYQFTYSWPNGALDNRVPSLIGASNTCWGD